MSIIVDKCSKPPYLLAYIVLDRVDRGRLALAAFEIIAD
jgi:hypothetical protein